MLSNIYSRSKNLYNGRSGQQQRSGLSSGLSSGRGGRSGGGRRGGGSGTGGGSSSATTSTTDPTAAKKSEITVQQTFELNAVKRADEADADAGSQEGSEKGLVMSGWQADCYAGAMRKGKGEGGDPGLALWPLGNGKR
jgi:hypothetical protein